MFFNLNILISLDYGAGDGSGNARYIRSLCNSAGPAATTGEQDSDGSKSAHFSPAGCDPADSDASGGVADRFGGLGGFYGGRQNLQRFQIDDSPITDGYTGVDGRR